LNSVIIASLLGLFKYYSFFFQVSLYVFEILFDFNIVHWRLVRIAFFVSFTLMNCHVIAQNVQVSLSIVMFVVCKTYLFFGMTILNLYEEHCKHA